MFCYSIPKRRGNTEINKRVKKVLYNLILQHPQILQSPISNDCHKLSLDGHSEVQLVTKHLLQVSFQELHNIMVSSIDKLNFMKQEMLTIISSLLILCYAQFYRPN